MEQEQILQPYEAESYEPTKMQTLAGVILIIGSICNYLFSYAHLCFYGMPDILIFIAPACFIAAGIILWLKSSNLAVRIGIALIFTSRLIDYFYAYLHPFIPQLFMTLTPLMIIYGFALIVKNGEMSGNSKSWIYLIMVLTAFGMNWFITSVVGYLFHYSPEQLYHEMAWSKGANIANFVYYIFITIFIIIAYFKFARSYAFNGVYDEYHNNSFAPEIRCYFLLLLPVAFTGLLLLINLFC